MKTISKAVWGLSVSLATSLFVQPAPAAPNQGLAVKFSVPDAPVTVTASGLVKDKATGQPVANALVRGHIVIW